MTNLVGQSLGRYHILEQLGEGGMAVVYKAYDTRLETDVAVKVIRTENVLPSALERSLKRFEREAKALARLTHPNIVKVMDYGEFEGKPYLVMEYLPGGTLKQKLGKPISWNDAISILLPIAKALDFAHRQNMIHRDVKPSNILITADGEPMLTDFGIAKIIDDDATVDLTGTSAAVGTPEYMAPEQATAKTVDHRADIYALGVVLYEMVTGRKPFVADTPMAVLIKHATESLPRPSQFVTNLPDDAEKIMLKALSKNPNERYQSMGELAAAWQGVMESKGTFPTFVAHKETKKKQPAVMMGENLATVDEESLEKVDKSVEEEVEIKKPRLARPRKPVSNEFEISLAPGVEMTFMRVPAGKFTMGSPDSAGDDDQRPQHEVFLDEFWMGKTPVTNLQYLAFVKDTGYNSPPDWKKNLPANGKDKYPVVFVSWHDANEFCKWISKLRGEDIRLPTEAEWEKSARGLDGRIFPWGNKRPNLQLRNFLGAPITYTIPVGYFSPEGDSPYGCADMGGNVWEWVSDWYDERYYINSNSQNPLGPRKGKYRVVRCGAWYINRDGIRSTERSRYVPTDSQDYLGFRCARSV